MKYYLTLLAVYCMLLAFIGMTSVSANEVEFNVNLEDDFTGRYMELDECDEADLNEDGKCIFPLFYDEENRVHYVCRNIEDEADCVEVELY